MEVTWKTIFKLVENMWGLNQTKIASCLDIHRSTVSRLKNGQLKSLNLTFDEMYKGLFDPNNSKSPASGHNPVKLLNELKQEMKDMGLEEVISNLKYSDYRSFVIELLRLANGNKAAPAIVTPLDKLPDRSEDIRQIKEPEPERMLDVFFQYFRAFPVADFIECNPIDSVNTYLIEDAATFCNHINTKLTKGDSPDRDTEAYQNIVSFTDTLKEYLLLLKMKANSSNIFLDGFTPASDDDKELTEKASRYRESLRNLSQSINAEAERETDRRREEHSESLRMNNIG